MLHYVSMLRHTLHRKPGANRHYGKKGFSTMQPTLTVEVRALRVWDTPSLERAKAWWLSTGVTLCGTMDAYNNVAAIDIVLRGRKAP